MVLETLNFKLSQVFQIDALCKLLGEKAAWISTERLKPTHSVDDEFVAHIQATDGEGRLTDFPPNLFRVKLGMLGFSCTHT